MGGNVRDHHSLIHRSVKPQGLAPPGKKYGTALDPADPCASNAGSIAGTSRPMAAMTSDCEHSGNGLYLDDHKYNHHDTAGSGSGSGSSAKVSSSLASRKQRYFPSRRRRGNSFSEPVVLCKLLGWGFVLGLAFFAVTTYRETNNTRTETEIETATETHPAALFDTDSIAGPKRTRMQKGAGHAEFNNRERRQERESIARQNRRKTAAEWQEPEATDDGRDNDQRWIRLSAGSKPQDEHEHEHEHEHKRKHQYEHKHKRKHETLLALPRSCASKRPRPPAKDFGMEDESSHVPGGRRRVRQAPTRDHALSPRPFRRHRRGRQKLLHRRKQ
mmetsp:Transcript_21247/g.59086  ORF Transcript_21247/g.59086 Transcript_21247/m.59086 type:complete len:330 (-) Transcript_21247:906-1895(-)